MELPYDKKLVGKFLAIGAENAVYRYNGDKEVIKFPTFFSLRYNWNPERYCQELKNGFDLLETHLPQYLNLPNIYIYNQNGKTRYAIVEPFVSGKALTKKDLQNEFIKSQLSEIIAVNRDLEEKDGLFIDFFGSWGLWISGRWKMPNLLVESATSRVYLVDIGTANINDSRFFIRIIVKFARWIQNGLLKGYLK